MPRVPLNPADYIGIKYNRLLVVECVGRRGKANRLYFRCVCECGNESIRRIVEIKNGKAKGCGCVKGWVTNKIQQNNKSNNLYITYKGVKRSAQEWSEITGVSAYTIGVRFKKGGPLERVFSKVSYVITI